MTGSTWGAALRLTTFGESHGTAVGGVLDGCPAGLALDAALIQAELDKRRPGAAQAGAAGTTRRESDTVRLLSGVFAGLTTGTPIAFVIANEQQRSADYEALAAVFRPGHADWGYHCKYGLRDYRGGGRASGRETAARVAGGAIAAALLARHGVCVRAAAVELAGIAVNREALTFAGNFADAASRPFFAADAALVPQWEAALATARGTGDSVGGLVEVRARGVPAGLGEPVFHKLDATLAAAMMSVGAVKGVEIGDGFAAARSTGSRNNDALVPDPAAPRGVRFASNHAGGIVGGISTGQEMVIRVAVKPIPSIAHEQDTVDTSGAATRIRVGGRHDACAIPRIVPVLQAMAALTLADALLQQQRLAPLPHSPGEAR